MRGRGGWVENTEDAPEWAVVVRLNVLSVAEAPEPFEGDMFLELAAPEDQP